MSKVLIVTTELLPSLPFPTVGGGQRAYSLGEGLRSRGYEVAYSLPREHLTGREGVPEQLLALVHDFADIDDVVARASPDVVLFTTSYLMRFFSGSSLPVVLDLAANIELEAMLTPGSNLTDVLMGRLDQYVKADFFILGSPRQVPWYSPFWMLAGLRLEQEPYTIVPICCSPKLPPIPDRQEISFISAGMFYPWQDPFDALQEVLSALDARQAGELAIFTGKHPTWADIHARLVDPKSRLADSKRLKIKGLLPFSEIASEWAKYSCAIDVMKPNLERRLANPMRTTTYLWLGIPIIVSDFYWVSELVRKYDAGWLVDSSEKGAVRDITLDVLDNPRVLREKGANAQRLVAENLTWDRCVEGLDRFCKSPQKLPKSRGLVTVVAGELARMYAEQLAIGRSISRTEAELASWRERAERTEKELACLRRRLDDILSYRTVRTARFIKHKLLRIGKDKPKDRKGA
ncbi:MAG: glycosyltransferase family 4 protein [Candidatus Coatesbacteria bacterium]|nr:glycosyltransferase family 4 protein [Candidatus Coatesbacteria bacterium]